MSVRLSFRKDEVLFREGEASNSVYRLLKGEAAVSRTNISGMESTGSTRPGEFIGEMGTLVGTVRAATVIFTADSEVEQLSRSEFLEMIANDHDLGMRLLHALSLRTRAMVECLNELGLNSVPRLGPFGLRAVAVRGLNWLASSAAEIMQRRAKFVPETFRREARRTLSKIDIFPEFLLKKGSILFDEGASSQQVFLIRSGAVRVVRSGRTLGELRTGEFVGEMGVLESRPRSATVLAIKDTILQVLTATEFYALMFESRAAYFQVIDALCERTQRLGRLLNETQGVNGDHIFTAVRSVESVAQLTEQRLISDLKKMRKFFTLQVVHGKEMLQIYERYLRGEATKEEMDRANAHFRDYLKIAGIGTLIVLPGALLSIPLAAKIGKALGIDIFPSADDQAKQISADDQAKQITKKDA